MSQTPPRLFDQALLTRRLAKADWSGPNGFLINRLVEDLCERLALIKRNFYHVADLGTPGELLKQALQTVGMHVTHIASTDLDKPLPLAAQSFDLITSLAILQVVDDLPGLFAQAGRALKPDGLFMAAIIGGDTLTELRQSFIAAESEIEGGASPRIIPFADVRALGGLLQRAGLALPVADSERLTIRYDNAFALMHDLRAMAATNPLIEQRRILKRATLMRMAEFYADHFADADGRIRATLDIIWLSGWAPHESQQQPLKPGSAKMRLADALKTKD